jgi:hypothetical protein
MRRRRFSKITFVFACTAALLVGLLSTGASAATNARGVAQPRNFNVFPFSIGPGGSYFNTTDLQCAVPCDYDTYQMTITAGTKVHIHILDCCVQGDNICLALGRSRPLACAASPNSVEVNSIMLAPGTYTFYIAYSPPDPGGFPAGYDMSVTA